MVSWDKAVSIIKSSLNIALYTHISSDGDALGSTFGIALILQSMGKDVTVFMEEPPETRLQFLCNDKVKFVVGEPGASYVPDLSISLDCGDAGRLGKRYDSFKRAHFTINIDHHLNTEKFADINICDSTWAATCEAIWELSDYLGIKLDRESAVLIYTGILTDTGSFAYSNTTARTHYIAAQLKEILGDTSYLYRKVFEMVTPQCLKIQGRAFNKVEYFDDGRIAYICIEDQDYIETGAGESDIQSISNILRSIKGVDTGVLVKPTLDGYKISMRSSELCDVAAVAAIFGGGGHKRAAGFIWHGESSKLKELLVEELAKAIVV